MFPEGWAADGGMASSKAGMNGNAPCNGCNILYDEMIGDLCDSEGSDRLECKLRPPNPLLLVFFRLSLFTRRVAVWKQIVLRREYTYQRTVTVKGADGNDTHQTMRLRTAHDETHLMCELNYSNPPRSVTLLSTC